MAERDESGRFLPGRTGRNTRAIGSVRNKTDLNKWKEAWRSCFTKEDIKALRDNLWNLAMTSEDDKVRLAASIHILDRLMGKPTENVSIEAEGVAPVVCAKLNKEQVEQVASTVKMLRGQE